MYHKGCIDLETQNIEVMIKELEDIIHRHSMYIRKCRSIPKKIEDEETRRNIARMIRRLMLLSIKLEKILMKLESLINTANSFLTEDIGERLDILTFYIATVSIAEEKDVWSSIDEHFLEGIGLTISLDDQFKRILRIEHIALNINSTISSR
ncbi:hypothetical protein Igag_1378 [Ignisphaera aggregans DSM 17230]|uniref:Uncharacterized protein n=1 Tax=Ignisphaera aggregans (strain DSM 17230 / JCM 13409 / AQ1.S1) TaxID=583356 RepID=E0SQ50_IGNAA|nr:hypothetical protein Igag_1378 [Ignisphaera aggregans DSM 17230]